MDRVAIGKGDRHAAKLMAPCVPCAPHVSSEPWFLQLGNVRNDWTTWDQVLASESPPGPWVAAVRSLQMVTKGLPWPVCWGHKSWAWCLQPGGGGMTQETCQLLLRGRKRGARVTASPQPRGG